MSSSTELLLLLADGRWPGGGYAHSGGLEPAVAEGAVHDASTLQSFVEGRTVANGPFEAWIAAQACAGASLPLLNARYEARTPSPAQRKASASLGRGLLRSSARIWPELRAHATAHQPVAVGIVARCVGLSPVDAARLALHALVMGPLSAAPKLFSIDTADALRIAVALAPAIDRIAQAADSPDAPAPRSTFFAEQLAEAHATWTTRLFAS